VLDRKEKREKRKGGGCGAGGALVVMGLEAQLVSGVSSVSGMGTFFVGAGTAATPTASISQDTQEAPVWLWVCMWQARWWRRM
jgi:hypothetical protein